VSVVSARRRQLDNGLSLVARPNRDVRSIAVNLMLRAGCGFDPAGKAGAANLVSRLFDRGAGGLSGAAIAEEFDALGIVFRARARLDSLDLTLRFLSRHLPFALERLHLLATRPDFQQDEVARERARVVTEIAERQQDTAAQADDRLSATLFPAGHPYREPLTGARDSLEAITRDDLRRFHARHCGPCGAVLSLAGDFDAGLALDAAAALFSDWSGPMDARPAGVWPAETPDPFPTAPAPAGMLRVVQPIAGKSQSDIAWAFVPAIHRRGQDLQATLVMNSVLGDFGMGGRLGRSVREDAGLAYYASSHVWSGFGAGPVLVRAGVAPDKVAKAVRLMRKTVEAFLRKGPKPAEIADSKLALTSSIPRRFETNAGAASLLADCEFQGLGFDFVESVPERIAALERDAVLEAARRYLTPDRSVLVVTGAELSLKELA
jgi:zinc protease